MALRPPQWTCDRCGKDAQPFMTVSEIGGRECQVDLCSACVSLLFKKVAALLTTQQQTELTRQVLAYAKRERKHANYSE